MADKVVSLEFNVNTSKGVTEINKVTQATEAATAASVDYEKQLNDIKKATDGAGFKELNAALKQYRDLALQAGTESPIGKQALAEAGELKDRLGDLRTQIATTGQDGRALQASLQLGGGIVAGFGAVQGVMALVGSESEDLQKTLVKLQAAQAALVSIEEIRSVLEKESALRITATAIAEKARAAATAISTFATSASTVALKAFRIALIGTGIGAIVVALGFAAEKMGLFGDSTDDTTEKLKKQKEAQEAANKKLEENIKLEAESRRLRQGGALELQLQLDQLKANGATLTEIYLKEKQLLESQLNDLAIAKNKRGKLNDEELAQERKIKNDKYILDLKYIKDTQDANQKAREEERARITKEESERAQKVFETRAEALRLLQVLEDEARAARIKASEDAVNAEVALIEAKMEADIQDAELKKKEAERQKELNDLKINLALQGFDLINQLTALTENNNKESAKRAFNVNKAFQLAQATIEGYRGTLKAYQEAPPGFKIVSAGLAAAFAALQIAKISQTKFDSAKFDVATPQQTTTPGAGIVTAAPTTQTQSTILNQQQAQPQNIKAYVVESEITKTQKRVNSIIETASI
jgi:hypothetical protein